MARGWALLVLMAMCAFLIPGRALALLNDEEKAALKRVYQVYHDSKTVEMFEKNLRPWLDLETQKFLQKQIGHLKSRSLPRMIVVNSSRIKLKQGASITTVDFISLRTNLLAINGVEVEFQPGDNIETRWNKLMTVLKQQSKSASHPFNLFFSEAYANDFDDRKAAIADNLTVMNMLLYGINASAEYRSLCAKETPDGPKKDYPGAKKRCEDLARFVEVRRSNPEYKYQPNTIKALEKMGAEVKKAKEGGTFNCTKAEKDKASDLDETQFKALGGGADIQHHKGNFKVEDVESLDKDNHLNDTVRANLQGIREQMAQFKDTDQAENLCRKTVQICVRQLLEQTEERTRNRSLRCFMERIIEEIGSDGNPGQPTQPKQPAPPPPAQPAHQ